MDTNDNSVMSSYQAAETHKNMFPRQCNARARALPFSPSESWPESRSFTSQLSTFIVSRVIVSGDSANAVPPTKKLRTRVTRIWGDRSRQPNLSAMEGPRAEPTA